jgi:hypothetical protein
MQLLSVCERMQGNAVSRDRKRLDAFLGSKEPNGKVMSLKPKARCCV